MDKEIILRSELNPKIVSGLKKISDIVTRTLGPGGLPIIIQRVGQALNGEPLGPKITKDGVSVANECASSDEQEDLIIQAVKHICKKTNATAGDGTTTAICLGQAIVTETLRELAKDDTLNPQLVKESVEKETDLIIEDLRKLATPVDDMEIVRQVASISANGDKEVGKVIGDAFDAVGAEGVVTVDEGSSNSITLQVVEGYQIDRGAEAQNRFFNNKDETKFEAENAALIIFDGDLRNYTDLVPAINSIYGLDPSTQQPTKPVVPIVIMANSFTPEVIQFLLIQKAQAGLNLCAVKGPHTTSVRSAYYDDIAVLTGGTKLGSGTRTLQAFEDGDEGLVGKVQIDKYKCTLFDCQGAEDVVLERVDKLKSSKALAESPYDAQVINDRIGALTGGVAKIGVGGATEFEIKEKYDRIEDALNAARAAIEEGIVPGGGITLFRMAEKLSKKKNPTVGQKILSRALKKPMLQILSNIGVTDFDANSVLKKNNLVYDARDRKVVDFLKAGIIDPVKVTRLALDNAVSIASLLSTAGGGIVYKKKGN